MSKIFAIALAAGGLAATGPAQASVTFYTSEAAFLAAAGSTAGNTTAFNFNSTPAQGYGTAAGVTVSGVNFVGDTGVPGYYSLGVTPAYYCCNDYNNPNATIQAPAIQSYFYGISNGSTAITLPKGVTAFGLDAYTVEAGNYSGAGADTLNLTVGGQTGSTVTAPQSTTGFIGFVSTSPVGSATLTGSTLEDFIDITDAAYVSSVPEPATWAMLLLGFGGVGAAVRSRRKPIEAA